jgi:hypothetical protein
MARNLLEPILDGGVANPHYFEGRLLTAAALREEQEAQRTHHRRLGRGLGPGIVDGLWVTVEFAGSATAPPLLAISAGLAVNAEGETLELPAREVVALARTAAAPPQTAGLFHTCEPPTALVEGPGAGFYILVLSPASGYQGRAPLSGLSEPTAGSGCGSRWAMEGVRLRMVPLDPLTVSGLSASTRTLLESQLLAATAEADLSKVRNVVAHLCLGTEPLVAFAADPFARDPLSGGGTEAQLLHYGAVDDLLAAGALTACDVPLALLHWPTATGLDFADNWSVRRRQAPVATSVDWPTLTGGRRLAEADAARLQFQEQLGDLVAHGAAPAAVRAADYFRWLPPAGLLPLFGAGRPRGIDPIAFFTGLTARNATFLEGARLPALLASSLAYPPLDLTTGEMLWRFLVRENREEPDLHPPLLAFASGHVPYIGEAQFDLSYWNFSNFGPGVAG